MQSPSERTIRAVTGIYSRTSVGGKNFSSEPEMGLSGETVSVESVKRLIKGKYRSPSNFLNGASGASRYVKDFGKSESSLRVKGRSEASQNSVFKLGSRSVMVAASFSSNDSSRRDFGNRHILEASERVQVPIRVSFGGRTDKSSNSSSSCRASKLGRNGFLE